MIQQYLMLTCTQTQNQKSLGHEGMRIWLTMITLKLSRMWRQRNIGKTMRIIYYISWSFPFLFNPLLRRLACQSVQPTDGGVITVTATNSQGTTVANVNLNVHGKLHTGLIQKGVLKTNNRIFSWKTKVRQGTRRSIYPRLWGSWGPCSSSCHSKANHSLAQRWKANRFESYWCQKQRTQIQSRILQQLRRTHGQWLQHNPLRSRGCRGSKCLTSIFEHEIWYDHFLPV